VEVPPARWSWASRSVTDDAARSSSCQAFKTAPVPVIRSTTSVIFCSSVRTSSPPVDVLLCHCHAKGPRCPFRHDSVNGARTKSPLSFAPGLVPIPLRWIRPRAGAVLARTGGRRGGGEKHRFLAPSGSLRLGRGRRRGPGRRIRRRVMAGRIRRGGNSAQGGCVHIVPVGIVVRKRPRM
jgi:hypothetical protein